MEESFKDKIRNDSAIKKIVINIIKMYKEIKSDYVYNEIKSNLKINSEDVNKNAEKEKINKDNESNNKYENKNTEKK